ncbi:MAG: hypothetical protein QGH11_12645, partial [Pirellulaceae bacterium]|nr:hypothetical protein [Pirellulaceae bacterium]
MRSRVWILLGLVLPCLVAGEAVGQPLPTPLPSPSRPPLSAPLQDLQGKIRRTLRYYYQRPPRVAEQSPWSVMHSLVAFGIDTELDA